MTNLFFFLANYRRRTQQTTVKTALGTLRNGGGEVVLVEKLETAS